jgi:hypothetical protein
MKAEAVSSADPRRSPRPSAAAILLAVVLLGCDFTQVIDAWGLSAGEIVEPNLSVDRAAIRAAYADAADAADLEGASGRGKARGMVHPAFRVAAQRRFET